MRTQAVAADADDLGIGLLELRIEFAKTDAFGGAARVLSLG